MKYLLVGLGNIGNEYELTRHNIGFLTLDRLADQQSVRFKVERLGELAEFKHRGKAIYLLKPSTYMNLSGKAVNYWQQQLKIATDRTVVITDDVALPFGKIRLKPKGSSGGHNGLKHIEETLGTSVYPRLRIGIGDDYPKGQQVKYVLSPFTKNEMEELVFLMDRANDALLSFATVGLDRTMNAFN